MGSARTGIGKSAEAPGPAPLLPLSLVTSSRTEQSMAIFLIEREIPGASEMTHEQLCDIAATSNRIVEGLGVEYTWLRSYVAGDKIYCLHETADAETVRERARRGGFPADLVVTLAAEFGPGIADS